MHIDILCFTGHKGLLGPQGTGGIYVREGIELRPLKSGGSGVDTYNTHHPAEMPTALEAGTLNGHGIAGFFAFYPTTNVRPELVGNGIFVQGMRFLYQIDKPVNLFPSIHCMASWFCCIGIRGDKKVPGWYKIVSVMIAVLVFVSTLVTKQHVIVDVIGGVAVAELTWFVSCRTNGWKIYRNLVRKAGGENGK